MRQRRGPHAQPEAQRMPVAQPADAGAVRRIRGSRRPLQAGRPQDPDLRRGAAGEHAFAEGGSTADPGRWPGSGGIDAGAVRCPPERSPAVARRRPDRPARHRPFVADAMRCVQAQGRRGAGNGSRSARQGLRGRAARTGRGRGAIHDDGMDRRPRGDARGARLRAVEPLGRQLRHARRAGIPAPASGPHSHRDARCRGAAVDDQHARCVAHAPGDLRRGAPRVRRVARVQVTPSGSRRHAEHDRRCAGPRGSRCRRRRSAHRRILARCI